MKKIGIICSVSFVFIANLFAQDPHFSMNYAVPMNMNPALTGIMNGNYRFSGLYRSQWGVVLANDQVSSFRSIAGAVDFRTNRGFADNDAVGIGISLLHDDAGQAKFTTNKAALNFAYSKGLSRYGEHFISAGFQAGVIQRTISFSGLSFGTQYDGLKYNPTSPSGEVFLDNNLFMYDLSAGLLWSLATNDRTQFHAGGSLMHINKPKQSFTGGNAQLPMLINGHIGAKFPMGGQIDLLPRAMVMLQEKNMETQVGADVKYFFDSREPNGNALYGGLMTRVVGGVGANSTSKQYAVDAVALLAKADVNGFQVGAAYDINVSKLTPASRYNGAIEFSLAYVGKFSKNRRTSRMFCPKF